MIDIMIGSERHTFANLAAVRALSRRPASHPTCPPRTHVDRRERAQCPLT